MVVLLVWYVCSRMICLGDRSHAVSHCLQNMLLLCLLRVHWPPQEVVLLMNYAQDSLQMPVECVVSILHLFVISDTTVDNNHCQRQQHHS